MSARSKTTKPFAGNRLQSFVRFRPKVWAGLLLVVLAGLAGSFLWRQQLEVVAQDPRFQVTPDAVTITPPPPWIRTDVRSEVLRDAALVGKLSLLDDWDSLIGRVRQGFESHPWVASVKRITRRLPNSLEIELEYRRPVAAVESRSESGVVLLPVDGAGVRLPETDLSEAELRYLPRISEVLGRPMVGHGWEDPRVLGGIKLASTLYDVWRQLRLVEIIPSAHPIVQGDYRHYSYEIVTSGRTRIVWGAAPGDEQTAGESSVATKRQRLLDFAARNGRLDAIDGPASVDVRKELVVVPRTAKREESIK
jgi:hypothetical protein